MNIAMLIDYDNLRLDQKNSGMLDIVTKALMFLPKETPSNTGICEVRIYGGWYEGASMTTLAQQLSVSIQNEFPAIIRIPTNIGLSVKVSAELAVALVEEPSHHLFGTFRKKGKPNNLRISSPLEVGCNNQGCALALAKKLIKNGTCPVAGCNITNSNLVYRHEQKIVDTMLSCDLLYLASQNYSYIMLISEDDDFLPPIRTALIRGMKIFRIHPTQNRQRVPMKFSGNNLIELDL